MTKLKKNKKKTALLSILAALAVVGAILAIQASTALAVTVNPQPVSISVGRGPDEPVPPFTAKFEPSGTHVKDGLLKVRIDIYPSEGSKCYDEYNVQVPARELTEEEWEMFVVGEPPDLYIDEKKLNEYIDKEIGWTSRLNPCLCHFIVIDPDMSKADIEDYVSSVFTKELVADLDDIMSTGGDIRDVSSLMRGKNIAVENLDDARVEKQEEDRAVLDAKSELDKLEVSVGDTALVAQ